VYLREGISIGKFSKKKNENNGIKNNVGLRVFDTIPIPYRVKSWAFLHFAQLRAHLTAYYDEFVHWEPILQAHIVDVDAVRNQPDLSRVMTIHVQRFRLPDEARRQTTVSSQIRHHETVFGGGRASIDLLEDAQGGSNCSHYSSIEQKETLMTNLGRGQV